MLSIIFRKINNVLLKFNLELRRISKKDHLYPKLYSQESLTNKLFYNVGAGAFYHKHWTNIDYISDWYKGVQKPNVLHHDLTSLKPLPIADNSAELIYTSHTVEHITDEAVKFFLKDSLRALKKGGGIRITTGPDAETDFRAMMNGDEDWFYWDKMYSKPGQYEMMYKQPADSVPLEERWLRHVCTQLAPNDLSPSQHKFTSDEIKKIIQEKGFEGSLDYFTSLCQFDTQRPGNHISYWTHKKLEKYLTEAGFTVIYRSGFGQSAFAVLRDTTYFDNTHPQMSIYIEAVKK